MPSDLRNAPHLFLPRHRYALRLIADGKDSAFLWDGWDKDTKDSFDASAL
ncbi:MAG: hypothetical protein HZA88_23360 [Verrucomicrobia bacterium]|nr:hypothetical protein [Verrucomicrobiota bacterium]